jgi:pantetheine-phosphate adenylyltransferase
MRTALYPGTFDPVTYGHVDIAMRASRIFPKVIAVVADNPGKNPLFSVDERLSLAQEVFKDVPEIEVIKYSGLIVNLLKEFNASVLIRGLRALSDFEYEFQMAFTNRNLMATSETVFLMPSAKYTYLSSTMVKQIARLGGDVQSFVPECVQQKIIEKYRKV